MIATIKEVNQGGVIGMNLKNTNGKIIVIERGARMRSHRHYYIETRIRYGERMTIYRRNNNEHQQQHFRGRYHGGGLRKHLEYTNGETIVNERGA